MGQVILASIRGHARRYAAGALAIVLGVAFVATGLMVQSSAQAGLERAVGAQYQPADLVIMPVRDAPLTDATLAAVREVDGVAEAAGIGLTYTEVIYPDRAAPRVSSVVAMPEVDTLRWQRLESGRLPEHPGEVALPGKEADKYGAGLGSELVVPNEDGTTDRLTVVGLLTGASLTYTELTVTESTLAAMTETPIEYQEMIVGLAPGAEPAATAAAVTQAVGTELEVTTAAERVDHLVRALTGDLNVLAALLLGFAGIAVFVAMLVVANTFTILLAQRTRELALLRCVGAGRRQVFRSVLAESLVLGAVASVVGLALAAGLAAGAVNLLSRARVGLILDRLEIGTATVIVPLLIGLATTVGAALLPARRATRVPPLAALRPEAAVPVRSRAGMTRLVFATLFLSAGVFPLAAGMLADDPAAGVLLGLAGGALSFVGVLLSAPLLVPAVVRLSGTLPAKWAGVPGQLALDNSLRNPRRTAATASALLIGVTLIVLLNVGAASAQQTAHESLDSRYPLDLVVSSFDGPLPQTAVDAVEQVAGVADTLPVSAAEVLVNGEYPQVYVAGLDPEPASRIVRDRAALDGLADGTALVSPGTAEELGLTDGTPFTLGHDGRELTVHVLLGVTRGIPGVLLTAADLDRLAPQAAADTLWVRLSADADALAVTDDVAAALAPIGQFDLDGSAPDRALLDTILQVMVWTATGLLAVAVGIAMVGVGNTLSLSVIERAREHALQRALGLTRAQLRWTLAGEAVLVAGVAVILGTALGIGYGYAGVHTLLAEAANEVVIAIPVGRLLLVAVVAVLAGLAASVLPARRAARIAPAAGLSAE